MAEICDRIPARPMTGGTISFQVGLEARNLSSTRGQWILSTLKGLFCAVPFRHSYLAHTPQFRG